MSRVSSPRIRGKIGAHAMALTPGTRIGPYEVTAPLGAGGMGEVYRATDTKLKRAVALKVLPSAVATDGVRLARLQREAEVLAALNHPHIAAIYGLEDSTETKALVMELVEGPTLADRIAQGSIPVDEALPIAKQIADALEAAHDQGIIHRDLKPANIKVRPDGTVKVLDFGLAKAMEPSSAGGAGMELSQSPTITTPAMTQMGMILGTAAYMSPEQARGKPVDKRADIWAFGCVLFEMLTGRRAFGGEDVSETLADVLRVEPNWHLLPPELAPSVVACLKHCVQKDRRQRLADIHDVRLALDGAFEGPLPPSAPTRPAPRPVLPMVAVALGSALLVAGAAWLLWPTSASLRAVGGDAGVARVALPLPAGAELVDGSSVAISPDGTRVVYVASEGGVPRLYLRAMSDVDAQSIRGTEGASAPFFSPDGAFVAFVAGGTLRTVSTTRGVVTTLTDAVGGGAWGADGTIVFRGPQGLTAISAEGGTAKPLLTSRQVGEGGNAANPQFLPDGRHLLVTSTSDVGDGSPGDGSIDVLAIDTGERKVLVRDGRAPLYLPTGHVVFQRNGSLLAVPLDVARLEVTGSPVEVLQGIRTPFSGAGAFSCSTGGTCAYVAGSVVSDRTVAFVDRGGATRQLALPPKSYALPRFSPTGDRVSFWIEKVRCDVEVYDVARGTVTLLASEGDNHFPIWTPDGQRVTYTSRRPGMIGQWELFSQLANGGGDERPFDTVVRRLAGPTQLAWSPDGNVLAYADRGDIGLLSRDDGAEARPFAQSRFTEGMPAFSPDGRWLAYVSDESGRFEVYVQPFPGPGQKFTISTAGGVEPVWARSGRELFFRNGDQVLSVDVTTAPAFSASRPRLLFTGNFVRSAGRTTYDVSPDGQTFVMLTSGDRDRAPTQVSLLLNWFGELTRLVPVR